MSRLRRAHGDSVLAVLVVLLALLLRLDRLEYHSFWSDEGISLGRSGRALGELLATMPVEQLPGYFVLLHFWRGLAGSADFAVRFLSVWPSVLAVAALYRLGADLGDRRAGLCAALLLAVNPLQIWYAQEARTYSWLMASALIATWSFWRLLVDARWFAAQSKGPTASVIAQCRLLFWGVYVAATTLTVYLQYYGFLVPLAHTLFFVGWWLPRRDWPSLLWWGSAGLTVLALFAPWAPHALDIFGFTGWRDPIDPLTIPWRFLTAYTVGEAAADGWRVPLAWLYAVLVLLGAVGWWRRRPVASLFLLSQLLVPWLAVFALALRQPDTHERYTLFIAGPLLLLAAGGLSWLGRLAWSPRPVASSRPGWRRSLIVPSLLILVALVVAGWAAIDRQYTEPAFQKPDFRSTAFAIQDWEQPGDLILVDGPDPQLVFAHYYQGELPVHDLRFLADAEFATIAETLAQLTAGGKRVWEVLYFHEPGPVQYWLATHGWSVPPTEYNGIRVTLYGLPTADEAPVWQPLQLPFGPTLTLTQVALSPTVAQAGDLLKVTSQWQVLDQPPELKFSLRLQTADGAPVQAQDYAPQNWFAPTASWQPGATVTDQRGFLLPRNLPPGRYQITLRLYDPTNGVAVETPAGQDVLLGEFTVTAG